MNKAQITALVIIFTLYGGNCCYWTYYLKKKQKKSKSNDDFLMSKSLGPVVLAGTLFAANTGEQVQQVLQLMFFNMDYQQHGML